MAGMMIHPDQMGCRTGELFQALPPVRLYESQQLYPDTTRVHGRSESEGVELASRPLLPAAVRGRTY